jgi:hypothetical protein
VCCKSVHLARQRLEQSLRDLAAVDREDDIRSQGAGPSVGGTRIGRGNRIGSLSPLLRERAGEMRFGGGLLCGAAAPGADKHDEQQRKALH